MLVIAARLSSHALKARLDPAFADQLNGALAENDVDAFFGALDEMLDALAETRGSTRSAA